MRYFILIGLLLSGIFTVQSTAAAAAPSSDKPPPFDQVLLDNGFEPVESALKKCEADARRELSLPYKLPPVAFTLQLGYAGCSSAINDEFEIEYLNEQHSENHYKINIRPIERMIDFHNRNYLKHVYRLSDGSDALYLELPTPKMFKHKSGFNFFVFERGGWQYRLTIDSRIEKQVPAEVLVAIANSVR